MSDTGFSMTDLMVVVGKMEALNVDLEEWWYEIFSKAKFERDSGEEVLVIGPPGTSDFPTPPWIEIRESRYLPTDSMYFINRTRIWEKKPDPLLACLLQAFGKKWKN